MNDELVTILERLLDKCHRETTSAQERVSQAEDRESAVRTVLAMLGARGGNSSGGAGPTSPDILCGD